MALGRWFLVFSDQCSPVEQIADRRAWDGSSAVRFQLASGSKSLGIC